MFCLLHIKSITLPKPPHIWLVSKKLQLGYLPASSSRSRKSISVLENLASSIING